MLYIISPKHRFNRLVEEGIGLDDKMVPHKRLLTSILRRHIATYHECDYGAGERSQHCRESNHCIVVVNMPFRAAHTGQIVISVCRWRPCCFYPKYQEPLLIPGKCVSFLNRTFFKNTPLLLILSAFETGSQYGAYNRRL